MAMELKKKEVILDGKGTRKIVVSEAGWDYSFRFTEIEKTLEPILADPALDDTFKFFCNNYYSLLVACAEGDVPSPEEAYSLKRLYLDNWYMAVWELNEDILAKTYSKAMESEEVAFRDGSSVVVHQANGLPSFVLRLIELENSASESPLEDDPQGQLFLLALYPKLAASCNGSSDVPPPLEVRNWPRGEINKWMEASRRLNPEWFQLTEVEQKAEETGKKKKARRRSGG